MQIETIDTLNRRLKEHHGTDIASGKQMWRILHSEDTKEAYEFAHGTYEDFSDGGIYLRTVTETRWTRKYTWVNNKYILEHLVAIPEINLLDLPTQKVSYECIHVFEDKNGNYLPPKWEICEILIGLIDIAMGRKRDGLKAIKKMVDPEGTTEKALLAKRKRIDEYTDAMFGNQSSLAGATKTGEAIIVPNNYERSK